MESGPHLALLTRTSIGALALAVVALCPRPALSAETVFTLQDVETISDEGGRSRILLSFGDTSALSGQLVTSAVLEVALPGDSPSEDVVLTLHAVETDWVGRSPTWTSPWRTAGGDLSGVASHTVILDEGRPAGRLTFDVTEMVREIADGDAPSCGFLLGVPAHRRAGLVSAEAAVLGSLAGAALRVTHRNIAALGFSSSKDIVRN
jgi:hypothetical protein